MHKLSCLRAWNNLCLFSIGEACVPAFLRRTRAVRSRASRTTSRGFGMDTNDGITLTFIGPSLPSIAGNNMINDNSIAFILRYKQFCMLFTGDGRKTEVR